MSKQDPSTANTKSILLELVSVEATALDSADEVIAAEFVRFKDMSGSERIALTERMNALTKIQARVDAVLSQDDSSETGTRNTAGGTVKAIRKATGRNMLAEGQAALSLIGRYEAAGVDVSNEAVFRGITEAFGGTE